MARSLAFHKGPGRGIRPQGGHGSPIGSSLGSDTASVESQRDGKGAAPKVEKMLEVPEGLRGFNPTPTPAAALPPLRPSGLLTQHIMH